MEIKQFISQVISHLWNYEAELAERLYRHKAQIWKDILKPRTIPHEYKENREVYLFSSFCADNNLDQFDVTNLVNILADKALWEKIRRSFDEEYVEYGFLSVEDGGRGEEF
jgi:hypothetical protein